MIESNANALKLWRNAIQRETQVPEWWEVSNAYCVSLIFRWERPKSHLRADGTLARHAPAYKTGPPDVDKLARAALDALTSAGVWDDDSQVIELRALKRYGSYSGLEIVVHDQGKFPGLPV